MSPLPLHTCHNFTWILHFLLENSWFLPPCLCVPVVLPSLASASDGFCGAERLNLLTQSLRADEVRHSTCSHFPSLCSHSFRFPPKSLLAPNVSGGNIHIWIMLHNNWPHSQTHFSFPTQSYARNDTNVWKEKKHRKADKWAAALKASDSFSSAAAAGGLHWITLTGLL